MSDFQDHFQSLVDSYNRAPGAFETNFRLGMFMSEFRSTVPGAPQFLVRAFNLGGSEPERQAILERLATAYDLTGDEAGSFEIVGLLHTAHPANGGYALKYARMLEARGRFDEASALYGQIMAAEDASAERVRLARGEPRQTRIIADAFELLYAFGELGTRLDQHFKAVTLGLAPDMRLVLDASGVNGRSVSNRFLLDLWRTQHGEDLLVVEDEAEMAALRAAYGEAQHHITLFRLEGGRAEFRESARIHLQRRWHAEGRAPLLALPDEVLSRGRAWLEAQGMPADGWFVCLHLRDGGFRSEGADNVNAHRNARPDTYLPAIAEIVARGGWLVRIGNKPEMPLPALPGIVDHAAAETHEAWLDLFLLGQCRFCMGSASGPIGVAEMLGRPVLGVDMFPLAQFMGTPESVVMPKLLRRKADGRLLSLRETMQAPFAFTASPAILERAGVEVVANTEAEILVALGEMFRLLEGTLVLDEDQREAQRRFAALNRLARCGLSGYVSPAFLIAHPELLGDPS